MKVLNKTISIAVVLLAGSMFISSCSRDGRDGRDGFDGFDGRDGNPIVNSQTYFVSSLDWVQTTFGAEVIAINTNITNTIVQTGLVQVFFSVDANPNGRRWFPLPYYDYSYSYVEGSVSFEINDATGTSDDLWYKVIVIPSTAKVKGVDMNDFEAVSTVYNIE